MICSILQYQKLSIIKNVLQCLRVRNTFFLKWGFNKMQTSFYTYFQKSMQNQLRNYNRWTIEQDLFYYFFVILHQDILNVKKKQSRFFKRMSRFLNNDKNHKQCRTHHQKKIKQIKKMFGEESSGGRILYKFYFQNVRLRRIDDAHLKFQLHCFLYQLSQRCTNEALKMKYCECYNTLDQSLASLKILCENYSKGSNQNEIERQTELFEEKNVEHLCYDKSQQREDITRLYRK